MGYSTATGSKATERNRPAGTATAPTPGTTRPPLNFDVPASQRASRAPVHASLAHSFGGFGHVGRATDKAK